MQAPSLLRPRRWDRITARTHCGNVSPNMGRRAEWQHYLFQWRRDKIRDSLAAVDIGAELSWVPAHALESLGVERNNKWLFRQADGTILERWTGSVLVYVAGKRAADEVVFRQPGDLVLLGSRTLDGLNFRVEPVTKQLVDAGPAPAAVAR